MLQQLQLDVEGETCEDDKCADAKGSLAPLLAYAALKQFSKYQVYPLRAGVCRLGRKHPGEQTPLRAREGSKPPHGAKD